jgi:hypothetical protein
VGKEPEKNTDVPDPMTQLQTGYLTRSGRTYKVRKVGEGGGTKFRDPQLTGGERTKPIGLHDQRMKLISNTMQYQYHAIPCNSNIPVGNDVICGSPVLQPQRLNHTELGVSETLHHPLVSASVANNVMQVVSLLMSKTAKAFSLIKRRSTRRRSHLHIPNFQIKINLESTSNVLHLDPDPC